VRALNGASLSDGGSLTEAGGDGAHLHLAVMMDDGI
jgi:hypothetical protein